MDRLQTGKITHIFKDKKLYSILLPKGGYLLFKLNDSTKLKMGDSIGYNRGFGTQSMYNIATGDSFSATIENIGISSSSVISLGSFNEET